ncbi:hypothetical protein WDU94_003965 [Cyamophila willieti]
MAIFFKMNAKEAPAISQILKLAQKFNNFYLNGFQSNEYLPFVIDGHQVGLIKPEVKKHLLSYPDIFTFQVNNTVHLNPSFHTYEARSKCLDQVLRELRTKNVFVALKGWRDECYEVRTRYTSEPLMKMERSATCLFGICNYGVDINGYIRHPEKGICIWLQKRSSTKQTWPGKWDNMVGGGLSTGYGVLETAFKEAEEEASVPSVLMTNLTPCGSVSFFFESERGLFPNTEFVFDLELPLNFEPKNKDGEVETFELLTVEDVLSRIQTPEFKTTSAPVVLDFLIRHGLISTENERHLPEIIELLHVPLQTMYRFDSSTPAIENGRS